MTTFLNDTVLMDNGITIGGFRVPLDAALLSNVTQTRNAAGDVSLNIAAGAAGTMTFDISNVLKQINSLLSTVSNPAVDSQGNTIPLGSAPVAKGFQITDFTLAYSIQGGALTSQNFRVDRNVFANGVANVITSILANGANGLTTAATASATTCAVVKIPVVTTYDITDNDAIFAELVTITPGGVTYRLYEMFIHGTFNYN